MLLWTPQCRRLGLLFLAAASAVPSALSLHVPGYENGNGVALRQRQAGSSTVVVVTTAPPQTTTAPQTPPSSPDVTRTVTVTSTSTVGRTQTTTVFTTVVSTVFLTSTSFATLTITSSNVDTATVTEYITSTNLVKRALVQPRTVFVDYIPRVTAAVPRDEAAAPWPQDVVRRDRGLRKRATIFQTVTQFTVVTTDTVVTKTNVVVSQAVGTTTTVSTITSVQFANAKTTTTVTSTLVVTSTSMTPTSGPITYTATQDLPSDIASSVTIGEPTATNAPAPAAAQAGGLSTAAKAGIGAGAGVAALALLAIVAAWLVRRRRHQRDSKAFAPVDYTSGLSAFHDSPDANNHLAHMQPTLPNIEPTPPAMMMRPIPKRESNLYDAAPGVAEAPGSPPPRYPSAMSKDGRSPSPAAAAAMGHQRVWSDSSELDSTAVAAGRYTPGHSPGPSLASELDSSARNGHRRTMSSGISELAGGGGGGAGRRPGQPGYHPVPTHDPNTIYYEMPDQRFP